MNKQTRIISLMLIDAAIINLAYFFALFLRFEGEIDEVYLQNYMDSAIFFTLIGVAVFYVSGLYNRIWRYASVGELLAIILAGGFATTLQVTYAYFFRAGEVLLPRSIFLMSGILIIVLLGASRLSWRVLVGLSSKNNSAGKKVLIVGAGDAGTMILKEMKNHFAERVNIVGFIDDDMNKQKMQIDGTQVIGRREDIKEIVEKEEVEKIVVALPSAKAKEVKEIIKICQETDVEIQILPGMYDLITGKVNISKIRKVKIEDLLGRDPVDLDLENISGYVRDRTVLVTGAGGSIGSEICRQLAKFQPKLMIMLDISENSLYDIENEMKYKHPEQDIKCLIKNIREGYAVRDVFNIYSPEIVFHAAAHKHVPLMENNAEEAVKNNIRGTYNLLKYADQSDVKKFVVISTDKAVNPTNVMGATKRVTELLVQHFNKISKTEYVAVRFGNVLGSRGSVIPLFEKQIAEGGPLTVTHPDIIRYFMTIPEAVQLVIQAGSIAKGGEIFVLDMGEPVKIVDLAESIINLSGYKPYKDIDITFTGLRPGEKMFEELITSEERCDKTAHERIYIEKLEEKDETAVENLINLIEQNNLPLERQKIIRLLESLVPEYQSYDMKL